MVAWYPGGPRSRGRNVDERLGCEDCEVRAETVEAPELGVGVHVESSGLTWFWPYEGGRPREDEVKDEPEEEEAAIPAVWPGGLAWPNCRG
jgi:hypothetical protein